MSINENGFYALDRESGHCLPIDLLELMHEVRRFSAKTTSYSRYDHKLRLFFECDSAKIKKNLSRCKVLPLQKPAAGGVKNYRKVLVPLTWENLFHLGTHDQRCAFNVFRLAYVSVLNDLIQNVCTSETDGRSIRPVRVCYLRCVGTSTDISYASDVDMNVEFRINEQSVPLDRVLYAIDELYSQIQRFNSYWFDEDLATLFDVNYYATKWVQGEGGDAIKCSEPLTSNCSRQVRDQHMWAFLRAVETVEHLEKRRRELPSVAAMRSMPLYRAALKKLEHLRSSSSSDTGTTYRTMAKAFYTTAKRAGRTVASTTINNKLFRTFSNTKFYERETYRSVGAYVMVVEQKTDVHADFAMDSLLDNYGFLLENLFQKGGRCFVIPLEVRLDRVAKYMDRMCTALLVYLKTAEGRVRFQLPEQYELYKQHVLDIQDLSKMINACRKNPDACGDDGDLKDGLYSALLQVLPGGGQVTRSSGRVKTEMDWFTAVTWLLDAVDIYRR